MPADVVAQFEPQCLLATLPNDQAYGVDGQIPDPASPFPEQRVLPALVLAFLLVVPENSESLDGHAPCVSWDDLSEHLLNVFLFGSTERKIKQIELPLGQAKIYGNDRNEKSPQATNVAGT